MRNWFNNFVKGRPIATTLNWLILPLLLIIMLIFGELSVKVYRQTISDYVRKELQALTESSSAYLDNFISEAIRQSYFISSNKTFTDALIESHELGKQLPIDDTIHFYKEIFDPMFDALNNPSWYVNRIYLANDNLHADRRSVRYMDQLPDGISPQNIVEANGSYVWSMATEETEIYSTATPRKLLCYTRMIPASDGDPAAFLNTEIYLDVLEPIVKKAVQADVGGSYLWQLNSGTVIFQSEDFSERYWTAQGKLNSNNTTLKTGYSNDLIEKQAQKQHSILILLSFLMVGIAVLLIYVVSRLALNRLKQVTKKFASFDNGGLLAETSVLTGKDEAAKLDQTLTALYGKYRQSADEYYNLKNSYHIMEYQMLISKINPHFLYNTLSAIRWSVLGDDKEEAADAVDHLVTFYRGILSRGRDIVPLQLEIETIEEYIRLQSYAYSRKLKFSSVLEPELKTCFILKFLLQPVIENSILHSDQEKECVIELSAWSKENKLFLSVWNNGIPIENEALEQLNGFNGLDSQSLLGLTVNRNDKESYGIYNIIARVRLLYGKDYGLWYSRPEKGGTKATFCVPLLDDPVSEPLQTYDL